MNPAGLDRRAIEALLPHRPPFLLLDSVESITADRVVACKHVRPDEPFFAGHFPGLPIMPGVLIVEALAQAGAVLAAHETRFDSATHVMVFLAIDKARFRRPVHPGDALRLEVTPLRRGTSVWKMRGEARVGDVLVAEAEFVASLRPRSAAMQDPA